MRALILAGGKGTRLRPLTVYTPKPIVPLGNRPFLLTQIETLKRAGITNIVMSLSYQPDKIEQVLDDGLEYGVRLQYLNEPNPMGTAGAYRFASDFLRDATVIFNGDILTDIDLAAVIDFHRQKKSLATIVLTRVENPAAYGLVETAADGKVVRFLEKPTPEDLAELNLNTINAGIYILEPSVVEMIPAGENYSFEYGLFPDLLRQEKSFYAFIADDSYWLDIGTPGRYLQAHKDLLDGKIRNLHFDAPRGDFEAAHTAEIDRVSFIADGCIIKPSARVINSFLGANVYVEEKAVIENSVVWAHTRINHGAVVTNSIVGRGCHIGRFVTVGDNSILGDKTTLTDYTQV
ncbi:MAG TPA: NDP-sugar synthase [Pyrinomonadaceae bacterium]|jgi:NDP-sugar pyrophosphorylase family protein